MTDYVPSCVCAYVRACVCVCVHCACECVWEEEGEAVVAELYSFIVVYFFRCKVEMFDLVCNTFFGIVL